MESKATSGRHIDLFEHRIDKYESDDFDRNRKLLDLQHLAVRIFNEGKYCAMECAAFKKMKTYFIEYVGTEVNWLEHGSPTPPYTADSISKSDAIMKNLKFKSNSFCPAYRNTITGELAYITKCYENNPTPTNNDHLEDMAQYKKYLETGEKNKLTP